MAVMKQIATGKHGTYLIVEDDLCPTKAFFDSSPFPVLPAAWDILKFEDCLRTGATADRQRPDSPNAWLDWNGQKSYDELESETYCTAAYAVTKTAAQKFTRLFSTVKNPNCDDQVRNVCVLRIAQIALRTSSV